MSSSKIFLQHNKHDRKSRGNSCKSNKIVLASNHKSFTEPSYKMFDQKEIKYFVYFEDLFSFYIFTIYELTPSTSNKTLKHCEKRSKCRKLRFTSSNNAMFQQLKAIKSKSYLICFLQLSNMLFKISSPFLYYIPAFTSKNTFEKS